MVTGGLDLENKKSDSHSKKRGQAIPVPHVIADLRAETLQCREEPKMRRVKMSDTLIGGL
jgi:hypothetical protein